MKVAVSKDACIGCGLCEEFCPVVFRMGDNVAEVKADPVPEDQQARCKDAAEFCPVNAISVEA